MDIVDEDVYGKYVILEICSLLSVLVFLLLRKPFFPLITNNILARSNVSPTMVLFILFIGFIFTVFYFNQAMITGGNYSDLNAFAILGADSPEFNTQGSISLLQNLFASFVYGFLLMRWQSGLKRGLLLVLCIFWVVGWIGFNLYFGSRISILIPFILVMLYGRINNISKFRVTATSILIMIITIIIGGALSISIASLRNQSEMQTEDILSQSAETVGSSSATFSHLIVDGLVMKFNSISWGAKLVEEHGTGNAGWKPYEGVFLALVPRKLLTSKPVPGSSDGTYEGHPSRLVELRGGASISSNVNVSPAAISIWQVGSFGLILFVVFNIIHLYFINSLLLSPSIIQRTLALYLIGIPGFFTLVAPPDVLLVHMQRMVVLYIVLLLIYKCVSLMQQYKNINSRAKMLQSGNLFKLSKHL